MADNYLERKMEEHRSGGGSFSYRKRLTPTGRLSGNLVLKFPPRRVFVTDGASSLGEVIVRAFREAGCRVAFCDVDPGRGTAVAQRSGARFYPFGVVDAMADVVRLWGGIDVLVNLNPASAADATVFLLDQSVDALTEYCRIIDIYPAESKVQGDYPASVTINSVIPGSPENVAKAALFISLPENPLPDRFTVKIR